MKKIITKIFISTFVLGFFSLGLNFVYGQSCNIWTQCYQGGCENAANYSWFNNSNNAYSVCNSDTTCNAYLDGDSKYGNWNGLTHVPGNINKIWSMVNLSVPNQGGCSNQTNPTCQGVANNVKTMQNTLKQIGCFEQHNYKRGNDGDCLLGYDTLYDMTHCCILPGESLPTITNPGVSAQASCPSNLTLITNAYQQKCCVLKIACKAPTIKINGETGKTKYTDNSVLKVEVDYSNNQEGSIVFNTGEISIVGGTGSNFVANTGSKKITFDLTPSSDSNTIKINVNDDCGKLEGEECPPVEITLDRDIPCQDRDKRKDCSRYDASPVGPYQEPTSPDPLVDYSFLDGFVCVKNNITLEFCPCTRPPLNSSCNFYFTGGFIDADGCCDVCGSNQKVNSTGTGCVCSKTQAECAKNGDKLNEKTCKCECDPTKRCCGILLNTVVPFIGDCIEMTSQNNVGSSNDANTSTVNQLNAFPFLMMGLSKIMVTLILVFSFLVVIAAGLMMVTGVYEEGNYKTGMDRIKKVVVALILLGSSGLILRLINPSFFGG